MSHALQSHIGDITIRVNISNHYHVYFVKFQFPHFTLQDLFDLEIAVNVVRHKQRFPDEPLIRSYARKVHVDLAIKEKIHALRNSTVV